MFTALATTSSAYCLLPTAYILAFGFVTPAFAVAGVLLLAIPIVIHILNRRRYKVVRWAAMEFLLRALRKNRRRLKFEQWMLLATRCAVLLLAAMALARPVGCADTSVASLAATRSGLHVLVIDNSYSMGYRSDRPDAPTHLDQAKRVAADLIARLNPGGESVAIVTTASPAEALIAAPTYDLEAARGAVERIEQSAAGTDLPGALQKALEIGQQSSVQSRRRLYLLTDATRSAWEGQGVSTALAELGPQLADVFTITSFNLGRPSQWNHAALGVRPGGNLVTSRFGTEFIATLGGFGGSPEAQLQWRLDEQVLPGGGNVQLEGVTTAIQSNAQFRGGGHHVLSADVVTNDPLPIDDARHRVVNVASALDVLIVEGERGLRPMEGSAAFLSLALAPPADPLSGGAAQDSRSYVEPEVISDLELGNRVLGDYRAVILAGVGQVQPAQADQLRLYVEQGGTLVLFMGEPVSGENYNQVLLPRGLLPGRMIKRVSASADQTGFTFDFNPDPNAVSHPLLGVFKGEPDSGLNTGRIFSYWQVDIDPDATNVERVLDFAGTGRATAATAAGDAADAAGTPASSDPAITLHSLGQGQVVFVATAAEADPDWSFLPAKPAYVALVHELLAGSVSPGDRWLNLTVGDALQIPQNLRLTAAPVLTDAQNREVPIDQTTGPDGRPAYQSRPLTRPGVYTLSAGSQTYPVAVNVPPQEADVRTIDNAAIREALGGIEIELVEDQLPADALAADDGNDYGWTLMLIVLALVGAEAFMAMRFGHYRGREIAAGTV